MSERVPTTRQRHQLLTLASGAMLVSGRSGRTIPQCERHGWIAPETPGGDNGYRITPDGLRALALSVERDGLPKITREWSERRPDPPAAVRLRAERDDARRERDDAQRESRRLRAVLRRAGQALGEL